MKIDFPIKEDGRRRRYCIECKKETVVDFDLDGKRMYQCSSCKSVSERVIDIDPQMVYRIDPVTKDYWHETVSVFVFNKENNLLVIKRSIYPWTYSIPAGHLERGEEIALAAARELQEETGIKGVELKFFKTEDMADDKCRRGADSHRWNIYTTTIDRKNIIADKGEIEYYKWLNIEDTLELDLVIPVKQILNKYGKQLI